MQETIEPGGGSGKQQVKCPRSHAARRLPTQTWQGPVTGSWPQAAWPPRQEEVAIPHLAHLRAVSPAPSPAPHRPQPRTVEGGMPPRVLGPRPTLPAPTYLREALPWFHPQVLRDRCWLLLLHGCVIDCFPPVNERKFTY